MDPAMDTILFKRNRHDVSNCPCDPNNICDACYFTDYDMQQDSLCSSCSNSSIARRLGRYGKVEAVQSIVFDHSWDTLNIVSNITCGHDDTGIVLDNMLPFFRAFPKLKRILLPTEESANRPGFTQSEPWFKFLDNDRELFIRLFQNMSERHRHQLRGMVMPNIVACRRIRPGLDLSFLTSYHRLLLQNEEEVGTLSRYFEDKPPEIIESFHQALAYRIGYGGQRSA